MQIKINRMQAALALYVLGSLIFFGVLLFPEDTVRMVIQSNIKRLYPGLEITIGGAGPALPFSVKLNDLLLLYGEEVMATASSLKLTPAPGFFFGAGPAGSFTVSLFDGSISGNCRPDEAGGYLSDTRLSGIRLEAMPFLVKFVRHRVGGDLSGQVTTLIGGEEMTAEGTLNLNGFTLHFNSPMFGIEEVRLASIEADIKSEGKKISITRGILKGDDFNGEVTGDILVMMPYGMSRLRLQGTVQPHASLISRLGRSLPVDVLIRKYQDKQGIPVRIEGTIGSPRLLFR